MTLRDLVGALRLGHDCVVWSSLRDLVDSVLVNALNFGLCPLNFDI